MTTLYDILQIFVNSLLLAGVYATTAIGLTVIMGVLRIINFAYGELILIGCYIAYILSSFGVDPFLSLPLSALITLACGIPIYLPLAKRTKELLGINQILYFLGISYCMQNILALLMSATTRGISPPYAFYSISFGPIYISYLRLIMFALSLGILLCLHIVFTRTFFGRGMRAVIQDREAAALLGVNTERIMLYGFLFGCALAGVGGTFLSMLYTFSPYGGGRFMFKTIGIIIIAGSGRASFSGTIIGSIIFALVENFTMLVIPPAYIRAVDSLLLLALLLFFPYGLGGRGA
ncbi:MAG: branched-chain amino acid ABC transporter permease [Candidatus Bathyarchaeia archaeon]